MANFFINYDADTDRLSIDAFRNEGYANSDIVLLVGDIHEGVTGNAPLEGVKDALKAAIKNGSLCVREDEHIINRLYNLIQEHEAEE